MNPLLAQCLLVQCTSFHFPPNLAELPSQKPLLDLIMKEPDLLASLAPPTVVVTMVLLKMRRMRVVTMNTVSQIKTSCSNISSDIVLYFTNGFACT